MYLVDTNIWLEILLTQKRRDTCKKFLNENTGNLSISDFSLHSIGVILFRNDKEEIFSKFIIDIVPKVAITTLSLDSYKDSTPIKRNMGLDFDDAYQYMIAKEQDMEIVTMDKDFKKVKDKVKVLFL